MKFTWNWLCDHLETNHDMQVILDALPMLGLEVESVDNPAERLGAFTVVEILEANPHPDADKLQVCMVNTGSETLQIVCGAPNARAGLKTVLAPVGTYVPGIDITIKAGKIRGQLSNGMLCAATELGFDVQDTGGIMELSADAAVGMSYVEHAELADTVIEIAITPNRGDCLGVRGVARDLAAAGYGTMKPIDFSEEAGSFDSPLSWKIEDNATDVAPLVSGRYFRDVTNGPSPDWMARRLEAIGQRPISALVDITNYVMFDLGRPLHAYDADKVVGDQLIIRRAKAGEELLALNEKTYKLDEDMLVIGDAHGADDIAGVMGGERSSVSETTKNMFLEIAVFDPIAVAMTGRKLQLNSDARFRFERGLDGDSPVSMAGYIARLVQSLCGGELSKVTIAGATGGWERHIAYAPMRVKQLTGVDCPDETQAEILQILGFDIDSTDATNWSVKPPAWRNDIVGAADLVEEIIRIYGYDKLEMTALPRDFVVAKPSYNPAQKRPVILRRVLAAAGMTEAVTFSFLKTEDAKQFGGGDAKLQLANPISADLDCMRPSILPNLLQAAARNVNRGEQNIQLFEVGPVYFGTGPQDQRTACGGILQGDAQSADWLQTARKVDVFDAKAQLISALAAVGVATDNLQVTNDAPDWFHPGRSGRLRLGKTDMGSFGELHPKLLETYDLSAPVAAFEMHIESVPAAKAKGPAKALISLSPFQPIARDFAFILDEAVKAETVVRAVRGAAKPYLTDISIFDLYQGDKMEAGKKSLAFKIILQPQKATFSDAEITSITDAVIAAVTKHCGGQLRGA